jgi:hypothetical protein
MENVLGKMCIQSFWWGNLREYHHLEEPSVDGRIILELIFEKWDVGHGLDRSGSGQGQALVNAVTNFQAP